MFRLSRGAEYAIRGVLHLASRPKGTISYIEEISKSQDVPKAYLAKIFQVLAKKGYLKSYRGPEGGFALTKDPKDISFLEIIEAMEGPIHLNECLIHTGYCERDSLCPVHDVWRTVQKKLIDVLSGCSFEDLAEAGRAKAKKAANQ